MLEVRGGGPMLEVRGRGSHARGKGEGGPMLEVRGGSHARGGGVPC